MKPDDSNRICGVDASIEEGLGYSQYLRACPVKWITLQVEELRRREVSHRLRPDRLHCRVKLYLAPVWDWVTDGRIHHHDVLAVSWTVGVLHENKDSFDVNVSIPSLSCYDQPSPVCVQWRYLFNVCLRSVCKSTKAVYIVCDEPSCWWISYCIVYSRFVDINGVWNKVLRTLKLLWILSLLTISFVMVRVLARSFSEFWTRNPIEFVASLHSCQVWLLLCRIKQISFVEVADLFIELVVSRTNQNAEITLHWFLRVLLPRWQRREW